MLHLAFDLSQAKGCQETARKEVRNVLKKYGEYSWESVRDMKYLDACIQGNNYNFSTDGRYFF